jgi:hypothetical protein
MPTHAHSFRHPYPWLWPFQYSHLQSYLFAGNQDYERFEAFGTVRDSGEIMTFKLVIKLG